MSGIERNEAELDDGEWFYGGKEFVRHRFFSREKKSAWLEEACPVRGRNSTANSSEHYLGLSLSRATRKIFLVFLLFGVAILFGRAVYLQFWKNEDYLFLAERNRIRVTPLPAPRGLIYDRRGAPLLQNVSNFSLYFTPVDFLKQPEKQQAILTELAREFPASDILNRGQAVIKIDKTKKDFYQPHEVLSDIPYEQAIALKILAADWPGVSLELRGERLYSGLVDNSVDFLQNSLSHLLGYVGKISDREVSELSVKGYLFDDVVGKTGLEKTYEDVLRGHFGAKQIEVDSFGKEKKVIAEEPVVKGGNLVLTIDNEMQKKLEQLVADALRKSGLKKAVALIEDPFNGEMLALVSLPSFNNNDFSGSIDAATYDRVNSDPSQPLFNRAVSGEYPSGSTIKPIIAAAALEEKIITPATAFLSVGGIKIDQWIFPDWKVGGHGITDVRKALAESVNTFFYIIGGGYNDFIGLGAAKMKEYGQKFGLMKKTGIDLPNEKAGFLPDPEWKERVKDERWYVGDTYHMAIGQGDVLATPLQVSNYISVFANGGTLYAPHLVKEIQIEDKKKLILPTVLNQNFISADSINVVRQGLRQTVTAGSARALNFLPVTVAGKTGTAEWKSDAPPHAWFTGFAPYDKPEIAITILVEEGKEGSTICVPIARDFLAWYFGEYKVGKKN
jgi:penicillin-binding protein 2